MYHIAENNNEIEKLIYMKSSKEDIHESEDALYLLSHDWLNKNTFNYLHYK